MNITGTEQIDVIRFAMRKDEQKDAGKGVGSDYSGSGQHIQPECTSPGHLLDKKQLHQDHFR